MRLTSKAFPQNAEIPIRFTCDGTNLSPSLAWSDAPEGTHSFAIVCSDPDAPKGVWFHWAIYDIPERARNLAEACSGEATCPPQARNNFGHRRYDGPCPPHGHGRHHYYFKLYALDVAHLDVSPNSDCRQVEEAAEAHAIANAELVGVYSR